MASCTAKVCDKLMLCIGIWSVKLSRMEELPFLSEAFAPWCAVELMNANREMQQPVSYINWEPC